MFDLLVLLFAVFGLWVGTEITLRAAIQVARYYRVSETVIGVAVLAVGTDLPELMVALDASLQTLAGFDASGVVAGTAVGSTMGQIACVLGLAAVLTRLTLKSTEVYRHGAFLVGSIVLLFITALDGQVTRTEGAILIMSYAIYLIEVFERDHPDTVENNLSLDHILRYWLMLIAGIVLVSFSAELTVDKAQALAFALGVSQSVVAIFIVGLGSSLPELVISLAAIRKKHIGLSVGNIVGSNVFDTLLPVGAAAMIVPMGFERQLLVFDLPYLLVITVAVLFFFHRGGLGRHEGIFLLGGYFTYALIKLVVAT